MRKSLALFPILGLLSLVVYILTLAPTITWRNDGIDSGDLATAVAVGGVPHPSGYPTYLLLGEIFKLLPFGDVAYRLNLLSATCAALTIAVLGLTIFQTLARVNRASIQKTQRTGKHKNLIWFTVASASLTFAFSGIFWSQAVIAEVYTLNVLFAALLLFCTLQVQFVNEKWLVPCLFTLAGLSLGNHLSILLFIPILFWIIKARWRWQLIVAAFLAFCFGLAIYLIIPIRAATSPPVNWAGATTWPNFVWLVSAKPYRQFLFSMSWQSVPARLIAELYLLAQTFMWWGLPVGLLGLQYLFHTNRALAYGSLATFLLISVYSVGYNTTDSYVYLLPALLLFSLWIGWGLYDLGSFMAQKLRYSNVLEWGFILLPILSIFWNFSEQDISHDKTAYIYAQQSLQIVERNAVIIADNDPQTFALWYGRYGLLQRTDVAIINDNLLSYTWYRQSLRHTHANLRFSNQQGQPLTTLPAFIEANLSTSPIYLSSLRTQSLSGYHLEPVKHLQHVVRLTDE